MNPLRISGELRLQDASGLMLRLDEALTDGDVTLDLSELADADAAVIQVLVSAVHTAALLGRRLDAVVAPAAPLARRLAGLGIAPDALRSPAPGQAAAA